MGTPNTPGMSVWQAAHLAVENDPGNEEFIRQANVLRALRKQAVQYQDYLPWGIVQVQIIDVLKEIKGQYLNTAVPNQTLGILSNQGWMRRVPDADPLKISFFGLCRVGGWAVVNLQANGGWDSRGFLGFDPEATDYMDEEVLLSRKGVTFAMVCNYLADLFEHWVEDREEKLRKARLAEVQFGKELYLVRHLT